MNSQFQSSLSDLEAKFNALLTSVTTSPTAAGTPAAAVALLDADDALSSAVETLRKHQENYSKIVRLRAEAENLEEKVKGIVRDVDAYQKEIRTVCDDESDLDSDVDEGDDAKRTKEVDYRLLLDFARRISKYNHQAAADAAAGAPAKRLQKQQQAGDQDITMSGMNGAPGAEEGAEPVSSVTKDATLWLDESANMTREVYMLPYPMEDRIRMGVMGQIQLAAAEGRPGFDSDKEVDRMVREAEGMGAAEQVAPPQKDEHRADEAAQAAANAGSAATGGRAKEAAPAQMPKASLDLDLYDPEDDDV
jgi:hypothetical protein